MYSCTLIPFLEEALRWFYSLTWFEIGLIFLPLILVDIARGIIKVAIILAYSCYSKISGKRIQENFTPTVSIIIPAHNEEKTIVRAIESALETDYERKEIIVVDDGSKDRTHQMALPYAKRGLIKLVKRDVASGSKAGALNHGILFATGEVIVSVDADTLLERETIRELVKPLSDPSVSAVSGNIRVLRGEGGGNNLLVRLQAYEYLLSLEMGRRYNSIIGTLLIISGALGAFWRRYIGFLGGYDKDTITEDFDVTLKMRKLGKRLRFVEKAVAWTFVPERWRDWRRQRLRWTIGQAETLWKHRNLLRKMRFESRFVLAVYDMIYMDIVLLFIRFSWFFYIGLIFQKTFFYIIFISLIFYILLELFLAVTAGLLSPRRQDLKKIYLIPIVIIFYRPLYGLIRLEAYFKWLLKRRARW